MRLDRIILEDKLYRFSKNGYSVIFSATAEQSLVLRTFLLYTNTIEKIQKEKREERKKINIVK